MVDELHAIFDSLTSIHANNDSSVYAGMQGSHRIFVVFQQKIDLVATIAENAADFQKM
jgi:hypothetical protein